MSKKLTEAQRRLLAGCPFLGPRPGSNAFPLLALRDVGGDIAGEEIDAAVRAGLLVATPVCGDVKVIKGGDAGPYGEIPDVECTHRYAVTDVGRRAIADQEGRDG